MVTFKKTHYVPRAQRVRDALESAEQATINRPAIHALAGHRSFALGRRTYCVPPIPYLVGDRLNELLQRWQRLSLAAKLYPAPDTARATPEEIAAFLERDAETTREWQRWTREVARICGRIVIPTYGFARWSHRLVRAFRIAWLYPNPLRNCTEGELVAVLGFLHRCRMSGSGRLRLGTPDPNP